VASHDTRTIHPALAERVSRFRENVAADRLQLSPEQPDRLSNLPAAAGNHDNAGWTRTFARSKRPCATSISRRAGAHQIATTFHLLGPFLELGRNSTASETIVQSLPQTH
jgi:hypothetical protein